MRRIHLIIIIITLAGTACGLCACQSQTCPDRAPQAPAADSAPQEAAFKNEAPHTDAPLYLDDSNRLVAGNPYAKKAATAAPAAASTPQQPAGKVLSGKMYLHTWAAQGEVWGTVVMNGNSGRGTIHDAEENTYDIRATRHGNELLATDQNGREYVFKL